MSKIFIGIDPGTNTGIAVWNGKEFTYVDTLDFWKAYNYCIQYKHDQVKIYIEVPRTKVNWQKSKHSTTSANIGGIYREAHLLADGLKNAGYNVTTSHPQGKKTAAQVQRLTGYISKSDKKDGNEHARDAMLLVYGR